ncbi:hypothetical protein [Burkholderia sp. JKS000303]|uniref:hypothetical protein n=1 Tax=Burkholderia sp. JKS000303 TaxID=1938747 RepID=UPI000BF663CE|nr:hypothetical protein [Burkholderia sp. JKS000303]PFH12885.1 hypothetical protein BX604_7305 [Burkholderia sp. JKS000303]
MDRTAMEATLALLGWRQGYFIGMEGKYYSRPFPGLRGDGYDVWVGILDDATQSPHQKDDFETAQIGEAAFWKCAARAMEISNAAA